MISSSLVYIMTLAGIAIFFHTLESKSSPVSLKYVDKLFKYIPPVVLIYALSMLLAFLEVFEYNDSINNMYTLTKTNLLPAMLFLMLLKMDFSYFFKLGSSLLIAYALALISLTIGFISVAILFDFNQDMAASFGALAGSWMGGTANMIAVGSALEVSEEAFGYALIVDSVNYTFWVMLLLFLVPFASVFNRFTKSDKNISYLNNSSDSCEIGRPRYWILLVLAIIASFLAQWITQYFIILNQTTTIVLLASLFGIIGSFTKLRDFHGSSAIATNMLYIIIALIGSKAVFNNFADVGVYVLAGFVILMIHAIIMILGAKIFKLDLFSVTVASLANIGGVASAPLLAATYNKSLVSVGVFMAIMGYLIGTFGGLFIGNILISLSK